jgi:hypothetical protein
VSNEHHHQPDDPSRALRQPFVLPDDWDPLHGHCSRCKAPALLFENRWWHDTKGCDPRKTAEPAHFILGDPPEREDDDA